MARGIELATGYVSLTAETSTLAKQVSGIFKGAEGQASTAGRSMGKAMAKGFDIAKPNVDALAAEVTRAEQRVAAQAEASAKKQEAAKRKVEIAQAKLNEATEKFGSKSSQALTAVDRLATSEQKLESETLQAADAQNKLQTELKQSKDALGTASKSSEKASKTYAKGWKGVGQRVKGYLKSGVKQATDVAEDQAERGGKEAGSGFSSSFKGAIGGLAAGFSVAAVVGGIRDVSDAAGEAEQSVGAIDSVFKGNSGAMHEWSKSAATAVGISGNEYRELGTLIGAQLKNAKTPMDELAGKTNDLITTGADLSSMFGGSTKEAVEALSSALKGEMDPIEKYGITLNETALQAVALKNGLVEGEVDANKVATRTEKLELAQMKYNEALKKYGKDSVQAKSASVSLSSAENLLADAQAGKIPKLDAATKAMAVQLAVAEQSADAQGNFAREEDTYEHKRQVAIASWNDMKETIGQAFLPALAGAMGFITTTAIPAIGEIVGGLKAFSAAWTYNDGEITSSGFPGFMERVGFIARQMFDFLKSNLRILVTLAGVITTLMLPVFARLIVQAALSGAAQVAAWRASASGAVKTAALYVINSYKMVASWVAMGAAAIASGAQTAAIWLMYRVDSVKAVAAMVAAKVGVAAQWVAMGAAAVASGIKTAAVWTGTIIKQAVVGAVSFGVQAARVVGGWVLMGVQSLIQGARMAAAWVVAMGPVGWVIAAVVGLVALIIANWSKVSAWTKTAWTAVTGFIVGAWVKIKAAVTAAWTNIKATFNAINTFIRGTLAGAFNWFKNSVITPVWNGIKSTISGTWSGIKGTFNAIRDFLRNTLGPVFTWLRDKVIKPVWDGIKGYIEGVWKNGIKPIFDIIQQVLKGDFVGAFQTAKDAVGRIWKGIANVVRKPINFVIGTVYNQGIKKVFDKVAGVVGIKPMPEAAEIPAFAKGGQMDKGWKLVGEEGPELINTGPGFVHTAKETQSMLAGKTQAPQDSLAALSGPTPTQAALPNGGILSTLKSVWDKGMEWVRGGLANAASLVINPIKDSLRGALGTQGFGGMISGTASKILDGSLSWLRGKDDEAPKGGGFAGSYDGPMGNFHRPSAGPFTSMFGPRWGAFHAGVDIAGGGPTFAALNGVVKHIGAGGGLPGRTGHGIRLDHGGGFETYYGHNPYNGVKVKLGQQVTAGQRIGTQGSTGNVTGTHLHFETLKGGRPVNPMGYLHDQGGVHAPGTWSYNGLKKPEAVLNPRQWDIAASAVDQASGGFGSSDIDRLIHAVNDLANRPVDASLRIGQREFDGAVHASRKRSERMGAH